MFNLTRQPSKEKGPHLESMCLPFCCHKCSKAEAAVKTEFLIVSNGFTLAGQESRRENPGTTGGSETLRKRWITVRPTVSLYLSELPY